MDEKKYNCECCNYKTNISLDWQKHINCAKHKRNGVKKEIKCTICNYVGSSHWNLKVHRLSYHSTKEEKLKHKYYCDICDSVMFSPAYYNKHLSGTRHAKSIASLNHIVNSNGL